MNYKLIREGLTTIEIPTENNKNSKDIFYNPKMELNRDITIAIIETYKKKNKDINTYIDAFSASGIRGIRAAKELGLNVILNDINEKSIEYIKRNISLNNVEHLSNIENKDANELLFTKKASIVDIDPFGSPSKYIDSAIFATTNLLNVTATDTAPLCGAHLNSGIRKYLSYPLNCEFHSEIGLRILLGFICRSMGKYEKYMNVLFSYVKNHYVRCFLEIGHGIKNVDLSLKNIGYVIYCKSCSNIEIKYGFVIFSNEICERCKQKRFISGPLWLGELLNKSFCLDVLKNCSSLNLNTRNIIINLLNTCINEINTPFYYNYHKICKRLKVSAIKMIDIIKKLRSYGYEASTTHMTGLGLKTNAPINIVENIIIEISNIRDKNNDGI